MKPKTLHLSATVAFAALFCGASTAFAQPPVNLGAAQPFAVLGGVAVTNVAGPTVVNGDLGISPGLAAAIVGFPPGVVNGGTLAGPLSAAGNAQISMTLAYNDLASPVTRPCNFNFGPGNQDLSLLPQPLSPGVYCFASSASISGDVRLSGLGNPNALFIFKTGTAGASTLTAAVNSRVLLEGGAQACNVFWAVSSSATIQVGATFVGNVLALVSITVNNGARLFGRMFAKAAIVLENNVVDATVCAAVGGGGTPGPCPGTVPPTITAIPSQVIPTLPVNGSVAVGFTIGGGVIVDALVVTATSSNAALVPPSAMVITKGAGGARVLTIFGADGRTGVATITITVTDPTASCVVATSRTFLLTVGVPQVPTLPEWALIALMGLVALAGFAALRRRTRLGM